MSILADRFLRGVKRRIVNPSNQILLQDSDYLELADDCMLSTLYPIVRASGQNYYVYYTTTALVADTKKYTLPTRFSVQGHREVKLSYDGTDTGVRDLTEILIEDSFKYAESGTPVGYYYEGNKIVLIPTPNSSEMTLFHWFFLRPAKLVTASAAALVVSSTTTSVTVTAVPTTFSTSTKLDFIQALQGCQTLGLDKTPTSIVGTTINFTSGDVPTDLVAGDYLSLSGESPVLQLPDEGLSVLETLTARRALEAIGDIEGAKVLEEKESDLIKNFQKLIERRNKGALTKIVPRQDGLLRGRGIGYFNNRFIY